MQPTTFQLNPFRVEYEHPLGACRHVPEGGRFRREVPPSYLGGGHAVAWIGFIIIGPTSQLYTFIFNYHVVHPKTPPENVGPIPRLRSEVVVI